MINNKRRKILEYSAVFQQEDGGGYSVWVPALPGCTSQGDSFEQATENIKEAIGLYLEEDNAINLGVISNFAAQSDPKYRLL